jgi:hypothetical protein
LHLEIANPRRSVFALDSPALAGDFPEEKRRQARFSARDQKAALWTAGIVV